MRDFGDFFENYIGVGFAIAAVLGFLGLLFGSLIFDDSVISAQKEYNLYVVVQGDQTIKDETAIKSGEFIKLIIQETDSQNQINHIIDLNNTDSECLKIFFKNRDNFSKISTGEISDPLQLVNIPKWSDFWLYFGLIFWLLLSLCTTFNIIWEVISSAESLFTTWPWRDIWPVFAIIIMSPFLIPAMLIEGILRLTVFKFIAFFKEKTEEKPPAINPTTKIAVQKKIERIKERVQTVEDLFLKNCLINFENKTEILKHQVSSKKEELQDLGQEIKNSQIALAKSQKELSDWISNLEYRKNQSKEQFLLDFNRLLKLEKVAAIDIKGNVLFIYTNTVNIKYVFKTYEIGIIVIKIDMESLQFLGLENLCNTHPEGRDHPYGSGSYFCWGSLQKSIEQALRDREFYSAVNFMLEAIYSAEGDKPDKVKEWESV